MSFLKWPGFDVLLFLIFAYPMSTTKVVKRELRVGSAEHKEYENLVFRKHLFENIQPASKAAKSRCAIRTTEFAG